MWAPAERDPNRRPHHRLLPPLPAVAPRLFGIVVVSVACIALTIAITAGAFTSLDQQVAQAMHSIWQPSLHGLFQALAELGGLELTTVLMLGLLIFLWRKGLGSVALVVLASFDPAGVGRFQQAHLL